MWSQRLNADVDSRDVESLCDYDKIYLDHGVNFQGSVNYLGGFGPKYIHNIKKIYAAYELGSEIISLDWKIYDTYFMRKLGRHTEFIEATHMMEALKSIKQVVTMPDLFLEEMIIGDSHCGAFSLPHQSIHRENGRLLYSILMKGLNNYIEDEISKEPNEIKAITLCLGSIDIRFHVFGRSPISPQDFAKMYARQVIKCQDEFQIPITVCAPVPVEFEERKVPKSGQYEGKSFIGSREDRLNYTLDFISTLKNYFLEFDLVTPPERWYQMDGKVYGKTMMELATSVHLSPQNYRSIIKWD